MLLLFSLASPGSAFAQTAVRPEQVIHLFDGTGIGAFYSWLVDSHRDDPLRVFTVADGNTGADGKRLMAAK